jgi:predicted dehydrogenase
VRRMNRRHFFIGSMAAAAGLPALGAARPGPNDRVRIAVIGARWTRYVPDHRARGSEHVAAFSEMKDVEIAALCDVDERVIGDSMKFVEDRTGRRPAYHKDFRRLLEDRSIDAVTIATPNQWHSLQTIWACQAGKDVYVEKPLSHTVWEGRKAVEAARKYGRVVQHGTQNRSAPALREAFEFLHAGKLGTVQVAHGLCYKRRDSIGKKPDAPVPPGVDYDTWLGPAPARDFNENRFHYQWHWNWDYGNGDIGNQGIHEMDMARWGLGESEPPRHAVSIGGRYGYEDDGQTPNTQVALFDYGDSLLIFEVRGLPTADRMGARVGVVFHGTGGYLVANATYARAFDPDGGPIASFDGAGDHFRNFIDCVRSRRRDDLAAEVQEGHRSTMLVHLANISYRLGDSRPLSGDRPFGRNDEGNAAFRRCRDHLRDNGIDVGKAPLRVGRSLEFDGARESFAGDAEADRMLRRLYRRPFVVPEDV